MPIVTTLARVRNPIKAKSKTVPQNVAPVNTAGTPKYSTSTPLVSCPTKLDAFMITSCQVQDIVTKGGNELN
jgi:hypothetical protein